MGKGLIIAEKPSVAIDISKALGGFKKVTDGKESYFESAEYVLSSAVGHLVELCLPNELDKKKGKWSFANLPIIPDEFSLKPIERTEPRLRLLKKLMKRDDVERLVNACDAGREGELIFRYIVKLAKCKKPIERLWLQSMTQTSIRDGFEHLRPGRQMEDLAAAAVCRSESDWLVGINGTRALTAFNSRNGGFQLTPVGRVQTPTLAIVVERDQKIKAFVPKGYWEVHATFGAEAGQYAGRWFNEDFSRDEANPDFKAERFWTKEEADKVVAKCQGKTGIVTEEKKPASQQSPLLYDLTTLQREANGRLGLSAKRTLQIAQRLYEHHKVLTYPRTDSRALPEDYFDTVKKTLRKMEGSYLGTHAARILNEGWLKPSKRIFNNAKISDHHAIIPTLESIEKLDEFERKVYDMVAKRFPRRLLPARAIRGHHAHHARRGRAVQDRRQDPARSRLDGRLWPRGTARWRRSRARRGEGQRDGQDDRDRGEGTRNAPPRTLHGSHAALRHGRRGQAHRRRGTARGDGGEGPWNSGHARRHHRRPALRGIPAPRRAGRSAPRPRRWR